MIEPNVPKNAGPVHWVGPAEPGYDATGLIHCILLPQEAGANQQIPAVVMVHGWGGDESVMWIFKQVVPKGVAIITPRAPIALDEGGTIWFQRDGQGLQKAMTRLEHFLAGLPDVYPIEPERLLLIGFSQGAAVINSLVMTRPLTVSGVASLSGQLPKEIDEQSQIDSLAGLPVFIAHGAEDDTIPLSEAQRIRDAYTRLEAEVTYEEYRVGHKMNSQGMNDLKAWMGG
ncbi:MAG TPA: dienelactone hydrolase family protein [Anaerolineae bacterium]|jgi:phospholipase/carboxylesterase